MFIASRRALLGGGAATLVNHMFGLANNIPSNNYAIVRRIDYNHNGWVVFAGDGSTVAGAETGNGVAANTRTRVAYRVKATAADSAVSANGGGDGASSGVGGVAAGARIVILYTPLASARSFGFWFC